MIPLTSELYSYRLKYGNASLVRAKGSVALPSQQLKLVYRKYRGEKSKSSQLKVNILFVHGTGMNKGIWHYHIDKLFNEFSAREDVCLNSVLAVDLVNHGDSAVSNEKYLGYVMDWRDNSYDLLQLLCNEEREDFIDGENKINVIVGHSLGGFVSMYTTYLGPSIFDSSIIINPVCYMEKDWKASFQRTVSSWYQRGYMKDEFPTAGAKDWYTVLKNHFTKDSFFINFDSIVLKNMLEDEVRDDDKESLGKCIHLKSTVRNQIFTYAGSLIAILPSIALYEHITVPTYLILGERDTSNPTAREFTKNSLQRVLTLHEIPKARHLVHAEQPDLTTSIISSILSERISTSKRQQSERSSIPTTFSQDIENHCTQLLDTTYGPYL